MLQSQPGIRYVMALDGASTKTCGLLEATRTNSVRKPTLLVHADSSSSALTALKKLNRTLIEKKQDSNDYSARVVTLVTGSLYLVGEALAHLKQPDQFHSKL